MSFRFDIASGPDDAELRKLIGTCPMKGSLRIAYLREPDFFKASQVYGRFSETFTMRKSKSNALAGMGTRAVKSAYVNGTKTDIGYLCNLRILPEFQKGSGLARGYAFLRQRHNDKRAKLYLTTIIEGNTAAKNILESGRGSLPGYYDIGRFCMHAFSLTQTGKHTQINSIDVRCAVAGDIEQIVKFLNTAGRSKQFFPEYRPEDFAENTGILPGLKPEDIYLGFHGGELIGVTAAWDQRAFRQNMIAGYHPLIQCFRPVANLALRLIGYPVLPKPRTILNYFCLALVCVKDNDAAIFSSILDTIALQRKGSYSFMMGGFHEDDPLLDVLRQRKGISYTSRAYAVCWDDGEKDRDQLDNRIPYLELGAL